MRYLDRRKCERYVTHSHGLQIILIALAQLARDHGLGLAHVVDRALNRDDALQVETVNVVNAADGNLSIGVLHDSLNCVSTLADNSTDEIVVREYLQSNLTAE